MKSKYDQESEQALKTNLTQFLLESMLITQSSDVWYQF